MSDRLNELRRQRALLQQHLEWLDAEIAAAQPGEKPPSPAPTVAPRPAEPVATVALEALLAEQKHAPESSAAQVRRGCFIAFGLIFVVLGLAVYGLYLYSASRH